MDRDQLIETVRALAAADPRVLALFLGGSLGQGLGDAYSDVDLIAVVEPAAHGAFTDAAHDWLSAGLDIVHWYRPHPALPLFGSVTVDWLRADLTVTVPGMVHGAKDRLKPLYDPASLFETLPDRLAPRAADPDKIEAMVREFLRILGLLHVAVGREEWAVSVTGTGMLRNHLIALMVEQLDLPHPPGALHLKRLLSAEDMDLVTGLPVAEANRDSIVSANFAYARIFLPRARALAERVGAAWPEAFEAATRARLRRDLGADWDGPALGVVR
ncbi:hypothetical protein [Phenylobacterium aquaticum]|uniref:hypothetical protein n=3 Tax=Phenylobacterium aquaticum TaxID=1763816 RepID=UPI0026EC56D1|nr:hypothetical protein [Phenylobacterium aquaticum]